MSKENRELLQFAKLNNFTFWHFCNEESQKKKSPIWLHFYNLSAVHLLMLSCSISVTYINWLLGAGQKFQAPKPTDLGICSLLGTGSCRDKLRALHRKRRTQHATICCGHRFNTAIPAGSPLLSFCFCLLDNAWVVLHFLDTLETWRPIS